MKRILLVDDKVEFPADACDHELVDCREQANPSKLDPEQYATAFIHERNDAERNWARKHFRPTFVFTGEADDVSEFAGAYTLPRWAFKKYFSSFLAAYEKSGVVEKAEAEIFYGTSANAEAEAEAEEKSSSSSSLPVVSFAIAPSPQEEGVFPIVTSSTEEGLASTIDFAATLEPLEDLSSSHLIRIDQRYVDPKKGYDGLDLLLRIRLNARHAYSRFPVSVRLESTLEQCIRHNKKYAVLCTQGVTVLGQQDGSTPAALEPLDLENHLSLLESLQLRPRGLTGRHDRANEWGPLQLWNGFQLLLAKEHRERAPGWVVRSFRSLQRREYYAYLNGLSYLRRETSTASTSERSSERNASGEAKQWFDFLQRQDEPLDILLVDDEMEKGWDRAVTTLFDRFPEKVRLDTSLSSVDFDCDLEDVRRKLLSKPWDLVLCDLRLTAADRESVARGVGHLTGTRLVQKLKRKYPQVPVVAFTASNRAWSVTQLREEGIDGYWIKESPEYGLTEMYSRENAGRLLSTIEEAITRRQEAAPLWNLRIDLTDASQDLAYVEGWRLEEGGPPAEEIRQRLRSIIDRLTRAYWYLIQDRSKFDEEVFEIDPINLAFLTTWSCLNEVVALYFNVPSRFDDDQPYRLRDAKKVRFLLRDPRSTEWETFRLIEEGRETYRSDSLPSNKKVRNIFVPGYTDRKTKKFVPQWPGLSFDTGSISWLLELLDERELARLYFNRSPRGLQQLRNNLDLAHGDVGHKETARLKDIHDMVRIWRRVLIDPYRE